jgi:CheY-like chemotaxis protein
MSEPRRILLVDDNDDSRLSLRCLLEVWGHTVEEADDGLEGAAKALAWKPHVALIDLDMPIVDGFSMARRVRASLGAEVQLIALTGRDVRDRALAAGFDEFLMKPADPGRLAVLLRGGAEITAFA